MMRNIKLVIEYEGTNYHGWQIQPGLETIQGILESRLSMITKADTKVIGSGRTDAGVHALGQVANFKTHSRMKPEEFKAALNSSLPRDIVIKNAQEVDDYFHSQFSATSRKYEYTILNGATPSAFLRNFVYLVPQHVDVDIMNSACNNLLGTHDFSSFASVSDPINSYVRIVLNAGFSVVDSQYHLFQHEVSLVCFRIEANAFLRGMVRAIAGTLLEIGTGKKPPEILKEILEAKDRSAAGASLPARGLCLVSVQYT